MFMPFAALGRQSIRLWWALALAAALILIGHDGLMAADAHAAPVPVDHSQQHPPTTQPPGDGIQSAIVKATSLSNCAAINAAQLRTNDLTLGSAVAAAAIGVPPVTKVSSSVVSRATEPTWPPGTRRALLQVYRI